MVKRRASKIAGFGLGVAAALLVPETKNAEAVDTPPSTGATLHDEIRSYLLDNPEVITEALDVLRARRQAEAKEDLQKALTKNAAVLYDSAGDPVLGNPYGDITVVMFSDYQCGYCKQAFLPLMRMVKNDRGVRVIMKELPILNQMSTLAAQYALAANAQGKYEDFYEAMMTHRRPITRDTLRQKAQGLGLNMARLDQDITDKTIAETLTANRKIAIELGLQGIPAFVIGSEIFRDALKYEDLKNAVQKARSVSVHSFLIIIYLVFFTVTSSILNIWP